MKKRSLIILLVAVLVGLVVIGAGTTYAWLTQEENREINYTVGDVNYTITTTESLDLVVPGQDIKPNITFDNNSNIITNLRVVIALTVKDAGDNVVNGWKIGNNDDCHIQIKPLAEWELNTDGSLYYGTKDAPTEIAANTDVVSNVFDSIKLNGALVGNAHSGYKISIAITYQVKQADYVTWTEMGTIDFSTGLVKTN